MIYNLLRKLIDGTNQNRLIEGLERIGTVYRVLRIRSVLNVGSADME